jgi:hypothetical protein
MCTNLLIFCVVWLTDSDFCPQITKIKFSRPGHRLDWTDLMCLFTVVLHLLFHVAIFDQDKMIFCNIWSGQVETIMTCQRISVKVITIKVYSDEITSSINYSQLSRTQQVKACGDWICHFNMLLWSYHPWTPSVN